MGTDIADISSFPRMDRSVKARRFFGRTDIDTNDPLCARQRKGKKGREERTCCNGRRKMARCHPSLTCLLFYSQEKNLRMHLSLNNYYYYYFWLKRIIMIWRFINYYCSFIIIIFFWLKRIIRIIITYSMYFDMEIIRGVERKDRTGKEGIILFLR